MTTELENAQVELTELEENIAKTIRTISELDAKMNQPEYTRNDIEIFVMNKKMEQDSLREYMQEKKQLLRRINKLKDA